MIRAAALVALSSLVAPSWAADTPEAGLPAIELTPEERALGLASFQEFAFIGNTAISDLELEKIAAPYVGRVISAEDLSSLCDAVTRRYVEAGYVTSGAYLPDQVAAQGRIEIRVVEGELAELEIQGGSRLREEFVRGRVERAAARPLNARNLESVLRELQESGPVQRIRAELRPSDSPGRSVLRLQLEERPPLELSISGSNHESPSIGDDAIFLNLDHGNLLGFGDRLELDYGLSEGMRAWRTRYAIPISTRDTVLGIFAERTRSDVVVSPFDSLDIEADSLRYGLRLLHPIVQRRGERLSIALSGELRRGRTYLGGNRFSFSEGADHGVSKLTVARFTQDWSRRDQAQVFGLRSTFSLGLDAFDATEREAGQSSSVPRGRFFAWLGQLQYARRFDDRLGYSQLVVRGDLQLAADPLLPLEQFSLGGARTVRGYPENRLVRDNGWSASVEWRVPLLRRANGQDLLQLAPFVDAGRAWDETTTRGPETLASAGLGLRFRPNDRLFASLYWGGRLRDVAIDVPDLQRRGFHFEVFWRAF